MLDPSLRTSKKSECPRPDGGGLLLNDASIMCEGLCLILC